MKRWAGIGVALTVLLGCRDASGPGASFDVPLFQSTHSTTAASWQRTGNLSGARHFLGAAAASADGRVFASGGLDATFAATALVEVLDPGAESWTPVPSLRGPRYAHASVRAGDGKIYVIGGIAEEGITASVEVYDPTAPSPAWTLLETPMSVPRAGLAAAVAGGKIYVTGGENLVEGSGEVRVLATGEVYDPANPELGWIEITQIGTSRSLHAMATGPDGMIYAIGGLRGGLLIAPGELLASVKRYDPETDTWTEATSLPAGRFALGAATGADGRIHAFGGDAGGVEVEATVFTYDVTATVLTWTPAASMNQARAGFGATGSPDGRIYAVGGITRTLGNLNTAEFYDTNPVTTLTVAIDIKPGNDPNSINRESKGNVPVAVLSSDAFDATTIDRSTVVFASTDGFAGAPALPIGGGAEDLNGDGLPDVVFHFSTPVATLGLPSGTTQACLNGSTTEGRSFEGCDAVRLVK